MRTKLIAWLIEDAYPLICQIIEKGPIRDYKGRPLMTRTDDSNLWWSAFNQAVAAAGGKLAKPEILSSTTDARFIRQLGIPALGFSPMINTPILLHDHNEVRDFCQTVCVGRVGQLAVLLFTMTFFFAVFGG